MVASTKNTWTTALKQLALVCLLWLGVLYDTHAEVSISGVDPQIRNNILAYLLLDEENCDAPDWRIRRLFSDSETEIREALEVVGYYNIEIKKKLEAGDSCWQASFAITPGQPVKLRTVSIEIDTGGTKDSTQDVELEKTARECTLRSGDILQHANYDRCTRRIARAAKERGYFSAEFIKRRIDVYPAEHAADIRLHLLTGPRYVFGATSFDQAVLDPDLIRRFISISVGEPYDATLVRRLQRDLISSAYFDQVTFKPAPRGEPHFDVPIHVKLTAGKKYQYSAGIGYATDVGPKLRFGVLNRRVNSSGHQIEFDVNVSKVISDAGLTYRIPLDKPRDWFTIDTGYKLEDNDSFRSKLFSAGVQRVQQRDNGWIRTMFLNLRHEDYEAGLVDDGISRLLTPGIGYAFVDEDYPPRPLAGHRSSVQMLGSVEGLVSDTSFLQLYGNTKWVFGLWSGARLLPRAEAGATLIDNLATLPASVRYFAGGDVSVRGYAYKSLGPTDPFGAVVGGENLLVGSVELDQQIFTDWSVAVFVDSGNAYNAINDFNPATGVGAGIRWFSPLGPIRVDIAVPLEKDAPDEYRVHITLGPDL
jgi:translocation and assembly module TamA